MISAPGYRTLVTHLFFEGDQYLESDAVFGVKHSLIVRPELNNGTSTVAYDFGTCQGVASWQPVAELRRGRQGVIAA